MRILRSRIIGTMGTSTPWKRGKVSIMVSPTLELTLSIESRPSLLPRHDDLRGASNLSKAHLGEHGHGIRVIDIALDMVPHDDVVILHKQGN